MRVLVACEFSGRVRDAFIKKGHLAWSCDLLETYSPGHLHYKGNVLDLFNNPDVPDWDLLIAHPPCTYLSVSGNRWYANTSLRDEGIKFVEKLWALKVPKICIENPIGVLSTKSKLLKPTQIVQPWEYGHGETKATCLWLKNLPQLRSTNVVEGREGRVWKMPPSPDRARLRSITYQGIADAMAEQWG